MNRKVVVVACLFGMAVGAKQLAYGQTPIIAPSTWAHITIDPQSARYRWSTYRFTVGRRIR